MRILIETIPHAQQRYPTAGDWYRNGDALYIRVSEMGDSRHTALLAVHELIEMLLCREADITQEQVDAWDLAHPDSDDPGSLPGCPYGFMHKLATDLEQQLAVMLNVDWPTYEAALKALPAHPAGPQATNNERPLP